VAWSPDGKHLAAAGDTAGAAQVLDATSGKTVFTARCHALIVDALAWSPDGARVSSGSFDRTACVWAVG
jgi:WD40 repeat protein